MLRKDVLGKFVWPRLKTLSELKYRSFMSIVGEYDISDLVLKLSGTCWLRRLNNNCYLMRHLV